MVIKTYARVFTPDVDLSLRTLVGLYGCPPDMRFEFNGWDIAAIGDVLLVGGTPEVLAPIMNTHGPIVVDNLELTKELLENHGATITMPITHSKTGLVLYASHADGNVFEYVQWRPEIVTRIVGNSSIGADQSSEDAACGL